MKIRRLFSIIVMATALCLLMTSCANATSTTSTTNEGTTTEPKPVTLTLMKMYDWYSNPEGWSWGQDPVTKRLTEVTGVTLDITSPAGNGDEKALAMLASSDYPDIMWMDRNAVLQKYIDEEALYAIDELTSQYDFPSLLGDYIPDNVIKYLLRPDKHLYIIPNWYNEHGELGVGSSVMIRKDCWLEVGSPEIKTMDDYADYLRAVKSANLKFGTTDVMPIHIDTASWRVLALGNLWGESVRDYSYYDSKSDSVRFAMYANGVHDAMKWWNTLYREELADSEVYTLQDQQITENYNAGKYAASICAFWDRTDNDAITTETDPNAFFVSLALPAGQEGVTPKFEGYSLVGWNANVITKNCKDPEAAIRFYNYYCSPDGQRLNFSGVEGITMKGIAADGRGELMDGVYERMSADWSGTSKETGMRLLDLAMYQKYNWEYINETGIRHENRMEVETTNWDATALAIMQFDAASDVGIKWANIQGAINTAGFASILTADSEEKFEAEYAKVLADYENMGLEDVEAGWTELYKATMDLAE